MPTVRTIGRVSQALMAAVRAGDHELVAALRGNLAAAWELNEQFEGRLEGRVEGRASANGRGDAYPAATPDDWVEAVWLYTVGHWEALATATATPLHVYLRTAAAHLASLLTDARVYVRVPARVLPDILADGRLKSQHEVAASGGRYFPAVRARYERLALGVPESVYAPGGDTSRAPVYGYVCRPEDQARVRRPPVARYGDVDLELCPERAQRVRVTFGNGLTATDCGYTPACLPVPMDSGHALPLTLAWPVYCAERGAGGGGWRVTYRRHDPLAETRLYGPGWYTEAQIPGPVTLADLARVHLSPEVARGVDLGTLAGFREVVVARDGVPV